MPSLRTSAFTRDAFVAIDFGGFARRGVPAHEYALPTVRPRCAKGSQQKISML